LKCPRCGNGLKVKRTVDEFNDAAVIILECPKCGWKKRYVDI
jgi:RNase P subunit RPR2